MLIITCARAHRAVSVCTGPRADPDLRGYRWKCVQSVPWVDSGVGLLTVHVLIVVLFVSVQAILPTAMYEAIGGGAHNLAPGVTAAEGLLCETVLTTVLVLTVLMTAVDPKTKSSLAPLAIGFAVTVDILAGSVSHSQHRFTTSLHGRYPTLSIGLRHPCLVGIQLPASVYDILEGSVSHSQNQFTASLQSRYPTPTGLRHPCRVGTPLQTVYGIFAESVSHSNRFTTSLQGRVGIPLQPVYDIPAGSVSHSQRFTASFESRYPTPTGFRHPCRVGIPLPSSVRNILP